MSATRRAPRTPTTPTTPTTPGSRATPTEAESADRRRRRVIRWSVLAAGGAAAALALAACGSSSTPSGGSNGATGSPAAATGAVLATATTPLGTILVDGQGKTLYEFAADSPGRSNCSGSCLQYWPPAQAPATVPASLPGVSGKVGTITRSDGIRQLTVNGWPLYRYVADSAPGMTAGQGTNIEGGLWWVVAPSGAAIKGSAPANSTPTPSPSATTSTSSGGGGGWA